MPKPKKKTSRASKDTRSEKKQAKRAMPAKRAKARNPKPQLQQRPVPVEQPSPEQERAYVDTLIQNGQAARLTKDGKLPAGATHKIIEEDGQVKVVRRRFSIA